jgi:UDP-2,3-diacylglucosamine pyrophosphatase LpxH
LYAAGNHDNFLSPFFDDFGFALLDHEFQHTTLDGKRYLVVHGDRFDGDLRIPGWKSWLGSAGYDALFELGVWTNHWRRCLGLGPTDFAVRWRKALPAARRHLDAWERASVAHARARQCDGIICGHVHTPRASYIGGLHYLNIGDWMEHGIALVETESGELCHRTVSCPEGRPVAHSVRGVPNPVPTLEVVG